MLLTAQSVRMCYRTTNLCGCATGRPIWANVLLADLSECVIDQSERMCYQCALRAQNYT